MLSGVCKLTVDIIMLALRSFINFANSNRSLHEYYLLVMAWYCRDALFFTALHGMQTRSSDENSVCPSVRPSVTRVNCGETVERSVQINIPH